MFTGIIEATGTIGSLAQDRNEGDRNEWRLAVHTGKLDLSDVKIGDSIAVNGCCLTVVTLDEAGFSADVSRETLRCTTLGSLDKGSRVNLEKAMLATSRLGGHIVSGHVDGIGRLDSLTPEGGSTVMTFTAPASLAGYIAAKGSICIDGTSLTVNSVAGETFTVNTIPHTQEETIIGAYKPGQEVNLEVDVVARYLERLLNYENNDSEAGKTLSREFLQQHGFGSS